MSKELRCFGPPGCGKTTRLAKRDIPKAVEKYGRDKVVVAAFTRAAAREIASREIDVEEKNVGTLHSLCFHQLGCPDLAVKHLKKWNEEYPRYAIKGDSTAPVDEGGNENFDAPASKGDELFQKMSVLRSRLVPEEIWPVPIQRLKKLWDDFKGQCACYDFHDLIETCLEEYPLAPGNPAVMFIDEAQDLTPIQFKLARSWGQAMEWFILVGDDDQTLFSWLGADPKNLMDPPVADDMQLILKQSYRVPARVHEVAMEMITRVKVRVPKVYHPKCELFSDEHVQGAVEWSMDTWRDIELSITKAEEMVKSGQSVMFLASCAYMLEPLKENLKSRGIPFHNPYRRRRGDWNPLVGNGQGVSAKDLLTGFIGHGEDENFWTVQQLLKWAPFLRVGENGLIRKQGKAAIKALEQALKDRAEGLHTTREVLGALLSPGAIEPALRRDTTWLKDNVLKAREAGLRFPLKVLESRGIDGIENDPKIVIGTVHSVKGAEAQNVFLMPDLSNAAYMECQTQDGKDAVHRLFYVGMTRASEKLILLDPARPKPGRGAPAVEWMNKGFFKWS